MGKAAREKKGGATRRTPLDEDIARDQEDQKRKEVRPMARKKLREESKHKREQKLQDEEEIVPESLSRKILKEAKKQQKEMEQESRLLGTVGSGPASAAAVATRKKEVEDEALEWEEFDEEGVEDEEGDLGEEEYYRRQSEAVQELSAADEKALELFMSSKSTQRVSLADIIMQKILEKEQQGEQIESKEPKKPPVNPKVIEVYTGVGQLLHRYRSGKVPKAFKIIPTLTNWEEILLLTRPDFWSPAATFQATRLFASNLNSKMAQRFYNVVLLTKVRDDIAEHKRLNYHLYLAVKKSLFKPSAFFKGFLLPLCESGDCTLREAVIIGSILKKSDDTTPAIECWSSQVI